MHIRQLTIEHRRVDDLVRSDGQSLVRRSMVSHTAIVRAEFVVEDTAELLAIQKLVDHRVRLVPEGGAASDLAFALFALDHAGDDKSAVELGMLTPGLNGLWREADPATRESYEDRARKLTALVAPTRRAGT